MKRKKKAKMGRPKVGSPISVTLTEGQLTWIDGQLIPGGTRAAFIRELIHRAMGKR